MGLPRWHSGKESTCQCRKQKRCRLNPKSEGPLGIGNGNPLQAKGAWRAAVCGTAKSWIRVSAHAPRSLRDMPEKDEAVHIWLTTWLSFYWAACAGWRREQSLAQQAPAGNLRGKGDEGTARRKTFVFWPYRWHEGSWFPDQASNLSPMKWKHRILTILLKKEILKKN